MTFVGVCREGCDFIPLERWQDKKCVGKERGFYGFVLLFSSMILSAFVGFPVACSPSILCIMSLFIFEITYTPRKLTWKFV